MNQQIRTIADLDRVIHEPGRLMIVALLFAVDRSDFLYLLHETGMNKGTLSQPYLSAGGGWLRRSNENLSWQGAADITPPQRRRPQSL